MEWVVQAAPLPCRTSLRIVGRVWCRIRLWLRPWSTFHMCPIELDSVQSMLVTDVYQCLSFTGNTWYFTTA